MINPKSFALLGLLLLFLANPRAMAQQSSYSFRTIQTCAKPDSINLQGRTCDSLVFTQPNVYDTLIVEYGLQGFVRGTGMVDTLFHTPYRFGNLSPGLSYEFHFQKLCGSDTSSVFGYIDISGSGPLPVAHMIKDSLLLSANATEYYFDATTSQNAREFLWDFGTGQTSNKPIDTILTLGAATYYCYLVVRNACGTDTLRFRNVPVPYSSLQENGIVKVQVYPNPAHDKLSIFGVGFDSENIQLQIIDAQGRSIIEQRLVRHNSALEQELDVSELANGIYWLVIRQDQSQMIERITISGP